MGLACYLNLKRHLTLRSTGPPYCIPLHTNNCHHCRTAKDWLPQLPLRPVMSQVAFLC